MSKLTYSSQRMFASVFSVIELAIAACLAGSIAGDVRVGCLVAVACLWFDSEMGELGCVIGEAITKQKRKQEN